MLLWHIFPISHSGLLWFLKDRNLESRGGFTNDGRVKEEWNIKDDEMYIFWRILCFNKICDCSMTFGIWEAIEE